MFYSRRALVATGLLLTLLAGCAKTSDVSARLQRAQAFVDADKYDEAKIELLNALKSAPQHAAANRQLGLVWQKQGSALRALPYLAAAQKAEPRDLATRVALGRALLAIGRPTAAHRQAKDALDIDPNDGEALLLLAESAQSPEEMDAAEKARLRSAQPTSDRGLRAAAALAWRKRNLGKAETFLRNAIRAAPESAPAHLALATCLASQRKPREAEAVFKRAVELSPPRSTARLAFAQFKSQNGDPAGALADVKAAVSATPDYLPAWLMLAQLENAARRHDDALAALDSALRRDSGNYDALLLRAETLLAKGSMPEGVTALEKLGEMYPHLAPDKFTLARAFLRQHDTAKAVAALRKAVAANPEHVESTLLLAELNLRAGKPQEVVDAMLGLLRRRPDLLRGQVLLIDGLRLAGHVDAAEKVLREQIRLYPRAAAPSYFLGLMLAQRGKHDEARRLLERALEIDPDNVAATTVLVDLDLAEGRYDPAAQRAAALRDRLPDSAEVQFLAAKTAAALKRWDQAEAGFARTLELEPSHHEAANLLAFAYAAQNKTTAKLAEIEARLQGAPNAPTDLRLTAILALRSGNPQQAAAKYEQLLALDPNDSRAMNDLAYLYAEKLDRSEQALPLAQAARGLDPASPAIADTLGWILHLRGEHGKALELLMESAKRRPNDAETQFHLGMVQLKVGQLTAAKAALNRAVKGGAFDRKAEAIAALKTLDRGAQ